MVNMGQFKIVMEDGMPFVREATFRNIPLLDLMRSLAHYKLLWERSKMMDVTKSPPEFCTS